MIEPEFRGKGDWLQTYSGLAVYPMDFQIEDVHLSDIAHALSMQCRYNGHVNEFYSVAEHSVLMADWILTKAGAIYDLDPQTVADLAAAALLHDAAEAYIGDVIRPIKRHMPFFNDLDEKITRIIYQWDKLPYTEIPDLVKQVDARILNDEREALLRTPPQEWDIPPEKLGVHISTWRPVNAEISFLKMYSKISKLRRP